MTDGHTTLVEQLRDTASSTRADLAARVTAAAHDDAAAHGTLPAGTRVFDTVSGMDGNVEPGARAGTRAAPLVAIRFASGGVVLRSLDAVIVRPTPPRETR